MSDPRKISFGFLLVPLQLLDMAGPMDVLQNVSTDFVSKYASIMPPASGRPSQEELVANSLDISWHHIGPTMEPVLTTGGFLAQPTCTVDNCPPLDYLLVGGPDPVYAIEPGKMPEAMKEFIRKCSKQCRTVFATCTGAVVLASTGVLDGQNATVNHAFVDAAKQYFPKVNWSGDRNWIVSDDGKFWTAGGACAGMDMMADWARKQVGDGVLGLCTMALEYQPRDVSGNVMGFINGRGEAVSV